MMEIMSHQVIYVPGLGDSRDFGQDNAIKKWKKFGLDAHYFPLGWSDQEKFEPKLKKLLAKIDEFTAQGHLVSLIGVSAGASAVLNAYARRPEVTGVVLVGAKVQNPQSIGQETFDENPAFKDSMFMVADSLESMGPEKISRILSIHPLYDGRVPVADTRIPGAVEKTVPVIGHMLGIFYVIAFRGRLIANFLSLKNKNSLSV
jgi:pimeloyl-ACP methyl ester carboxylesterase